MSENDHILEQARKTRGHRTWRGTGMMVLVAVLTSGLCIWQVSRGLTRQAQQQAEQAQQGQGPLIPGATDDPNGLGVDQASASGLDHRVVTLIGHWLPTVLYLDNRTLEGRTGVYVYGVMRLADGSVAWVNRGWAPKAPGLSDPRQEAFEAGLVHQPDTTQIVSLAAVGLADPLKRLELSGDPERLRRGMVWQNFDLESAPKPPLGSTARKAPIKVWPLVFWATEDGDGLRAIKPRLPDDAAQKHWGYALQWALMTLAALVFAWRLSPHRGNEQAK